MLAHVAGFSERHSSRPQLLEFLGHSLLLSSPCLHNLPDGPSADLRESLTELIHLLLADRQLRLIVLILIFKEPHGQGFIGLEGVPIVTRVQQIHPGLLGVHQESSDRQRLSQFPWIRGFLDASRDQRLRWLHGSHFHGAFLLLLRFAFRLDTQLLQALRLLRALQLALGLVRQRQLGQLRVWQLVHLALFAVRLIRTQFLQRGASSLGETRKDVLTEPALGPLFTSQLFLVRHHGRLYGIFQGWELFFLRRGGRRGGLFVLFVLITGFNGLDFVSCSIPCTFDQGFKSRTIYTITATAVHQVLELSQGLQVIFTLILIFQLFLFISQRLQLVRIALLLVAEICKF
mmetsp:Transcript_73211/g.161623  ORF Transcript_73211/g.161623 Transcript_73211/m.161623 type:complete len:346 (+) Transcript_73211:394-1431(+)